MRPSLSQRRQDFLIRAIWITFICAAIMSSSSLISSPVAPEMRIGSHAFGVTRKSPPQSGQQVPGSSSRRSRGVASETRGRRRKAGAEGSSDDGSSALRRSSHHRLRPPQPTGLRAPVPAVPLPSKALRSNVPRGNLALDLFRRFTKGQFPQLGDPQTSCRRRAFNATSEQVGHAHARWPIFWHSPPAKQRSLSSKRQGHPFARQGIA